MPKDKIIQSEQESSPESDHEEGEKRHMKRKKSTNTQYRLRPPLVNAEDSQKSNAKKEKISVS